MEETPTELDETASELDETAELEETPTELDETTATELVEAPKEQDEDSLLELLENFDSQDTQLQETKRARLHFQRSAERAASSSAQPATLSPDALLERREKLEARQLEDALCEAAQECARLRLPVDFAWVRPDDDAAESAVLSIASRASVFYVGGAAVLVRRWMGGYTERSGWMRGHCESYSQMAVVAVRLGAAGGELETRCIVAARKQFPRTIDNVADDSRGLPHRGANFVYIVWCD